MPIQAIQAVNPYIQAINFGGATAKQQPQQNYSLGIQTASQSGGYSLDRPNIQNEYLANKIDFLG